MKYRLAGDHEHTFEIQGPDGNRFHIAKSAVGPGIHKRIKALKPVKLADGGEVLDSSEAPQFDQTSEESPSSSLDRSPAQSPSGFSVEPADAAQTNEPTTDVTLPDNASPSQATQQGGLSNLSAAQMDIYNKQQAANTELGNLGSKNFQQQSDTLTKLAAEEQKIHDESEKQAAPIRAQQDSLRQDILNGKIDHNHLFSNMSTGNKVLAAISIALSGIGSGLTGKPNMAMEVIQKNIDRDIEDQKLNLGKKQTLFSDNLRQLGDIKQAELQTRAQMLSGAQAKIQALGAQYNSAQARLNSQTLNNQIDLQKQQLNQTQSFMKMGMQGGNFDPALLVPKNVPKERQKDVFDEIDRAQNTRTMSKSILQSFDDAVKDTTGSVNAVSSYVKTPRSVLALHQALQPTFKDLESTVRQAAMDNTFKNVSPTGFDNKEDVQTKRAALVHYLQSKMAAPQAKGFNIDLDKFGSTTAQQLKQPVERFDPKSGKTAIFDANTRQFLRYK